MGMAVCVVDKDGVILEETYGNCISVEQPFIIGSMSKFFTAISIMQLQEQGRIDLDASISQYRVMQVMSFKHTREERGLLGKLPRIGVVKSLYVRLPGNGAGVTRAKSRNERRGGWSCMFTSDFD
ncbi:serine hydrolase domain-containing protein [Roseburia hominis]